MKYVGLQEQITSNNRKSIFLLLGFPGILLGALYAVLMVLTYDEYYGGIDTQLTNEMFIETIPYVFIGTGIWFAIAYWGHSAMIDYASGSKTIERKSNMRVYNLTENLCMGVGMKMPKLKIIETNALNAFASGLNEKNYSVTLTRGIIDTLDDDELEGVIAHELMHIRNNDVRLLVISIIFVGIFSLIINVAFRSILFGGMTNSRRKDGKGNGGKTGGKGYGGKSGGKTIANGQQKRRKKVRYLTALSRERSPDNAGNAWVGVIQMADCVNEEAPAAK